MARFTRNRLEPLANVAGLGTWAASQMLLMITLAAVHSLDLVGVFSLGLTVFSLVMVALGLNLRLAIAVDREDRIGIAPALAIRLGTALIVYLLALASMAIYAPAPETFMAAAVLLGGRIADQVVDVFYGFQQKQGRNVVLSGSFFARGVATCLLCLCMFVWRTDPLVVILMGMLAYGAGSVLLEVALFRGRWRNEGEARLGNAIGAVLRDEKVRSFSAFPALDALHFSSFRLAVAPLLDTRMFGAFALALNAFSATQVLVTALGLTALSRLKSGVHERSADPVGQMLRECVVLGAACLGFFALCSLALSLLGAVKVIDPAMFGFFLMGNFWALLLFPFTGFIAQTSVFFGNRAGYWQAPLAGSLAFAAAALIALASSAHWPSTASYLVLCGALFLSCVVRISVSLHHLGDLSPAKL